MKEVIIFARAGQGAITTAAILGEALFLEEKFSYAFPHFGAARMGAPMNSFLRFDTRPIRIRSKIYTPDYVIVIDPTLLHSLDCFAGLKEGGVAIINSSEQITPPQSSQKVYCVPALEIALSTIGRPFANTVLLGAFSKATGEVNLDSIIEAVRRRFIKTKPEVLEKNIEAVRKGYESIK